jgi:hypothetical protein
MPTTAMLALCTRLETNAMALDWFPRDRFVKRSRKREYNDIMHLHRPDTRSCVVQLTTDPNCFKKKRR